MCCFESRVYICFETKFSKICQLVGCTALILNDETFFSYRPALVDPLSAESPTYPICGNAFFITRSAVGAGPFMGLSALL